MKLEELFEEAEKYGFDWLEKNEVDSTNVRWGARTNSQGISVRGFGKTAKEALEDLLNKAKDGNNPKT